MYGRGEFYKAGVTDKPVSIVAKATPHGIWKRITFTETKGLKR